MPFKIIKNDITKMNTDVIVNAANTALTPGGGVCGAIFKAAGYDRLNAECRKIGSCNTGQAVITKGFDLPSKYIIHTPGPIYSGNESENKLLYSCYMSSLKLAERVKAESIAFPLISSGIYGYPKSLALNIATKAILDYLHEKDMMIYLVIYDKADFCTNSKTISDVLQYIKAVPTSKHMAASMVRKEKSCLSACPVQFENIFDNMDASFSEYLISLIDESGMTDSQVYKKANIDRKHFSKIKNDPNYKPSKMTAIAFAIALDLDIDATEELIGKAGYTLTHSSKFDIVIEYFITHGNYDIFEINEVLFEFDLPLL